MVSDSLIDLVLMDSLPFRPGSFGGCLTFVLGIWSSTSGMPVPSSHTLPADLLASSGMISSM